MSQSSLNFGEITQNAFHQLYLPILSSTLSTHPLSQSNILSKHLLYYSIIQNTGVCVKRIQPPAGSIFTTSPKNKQAKDEYFSSTIQISDDDTIQSIFKKTTTPGYILEQWLKVSDNLLIWPIYHYICDHQAIQFVVPKASQSLEDFIKYRQERDLTFNIQDIYSITKQLVQILYLLEKNNMYHLNITPSNLIIDTITRKYIQVRLTDFSSKIQIIRTYYDLLMNFINSQSIRQPSLNKRYSSFENENQIDQSQLLFSSFAKQTLKNKQEQWLANYFENDVLAKCLLNEIQRLTGDVQENMIKIFRFFDKIMVCFSVICLIRNQTQEEFKAQLSKKAKESNSQVPSDFKGLTQVLQNYIQTSNGSQNGAQSNTNLAKPIHDILQCLLSNSKESNNKLHQFFNEIEGDIEKEVPTLGLHSQIGKGSYLISQISDSESLSPVQTVMRDEIDSQYNQSITQSFDLREDLVEKVNLIFNYQKHKLIVYFTNRPYSSYILLERSEFPEMKLQEDKCNITELFTEEQITLFFRSTQRYEEQIALSQQQSLIIIKCSKNTLKFFTDIKAQNKFFSQTWLSNLVEFDLTNIEEILDWFKLFGVLNGSLNLSMSTLQIFGDHSIQRLIQGILLLDKLKYLNLNLQNNLIQLDSIFSLLSLIIFTLPNLEDCLVNLKSENTQQEIAINNHDLSALLSPLQQMRKIQSSNELIKQNSKLKKFKINLSQQLTVKTIPILNDYIQYLKSVQDFSLDLSHIEQDDNCSQNLLECISENFNSLISFELNLQKTNFNMSYLSHLKQLVQKLKKFVLNISDVKLSQKSCEQFSNIFTNENQDSLIDHLDLNFKSCQIGDNGLTKISQIFKSLPQLITLSLDLEKNSISEDGSQVLIKSLTNLKNLKILKLNLRTNHIGQFGLNNLGDIECSNQLIDLELDLYNNQLQDRGFVVMGIQISKFVNLRKIILNAGMNNVKEGCIMILGTFFSQLKELRSIDLNLELNIFETEPVSQKVEWPLKNLAKTCSLHHFSVNLQNCPGLKQDFMTLFFNVLGCLTSLRSLSLDFCSIVNSNTTLELLGQQIFQLKHLNEFYVDMRKCKITDGQISVLSFYVNQIINLKTLTIKLEGNEISESIDRLAEKICDLKSLKTLIIDISKNPLDKDYISIFIQQFSRKLELEVFHLTMRDVKLLLKLSIARSLLRMDDVIELTINLRDNKIKLKGSQILGQSLNQLRNLKVLNLDLGLRRQQILYDSSDQYKSLKQKLTFSNFL